MTDDDVWAAERRLWLEGEPAFNELLDASCTHVYPAPVGVLAGKEAIEARIRGNPRWDSVDFSEQVLARSPETAVIAYRACGRRGEFAPYDVYCSSTYRRDGDAWRLVQHQHTPVGTAARN